MTERQATKADAGKACVCGHVIYNVPRKGANCFCNNPRVLVQDKNPLGYREKKPVIDVNSIADFEFWHNCYKVRTKVWMRKHLKFLKTSGLQGETSEKRSDKIKALYFALGEPVPKSVAFTI
jgi:hypothetical protein